MTATTSSGARTTATTSSGARMTVTTSSGVPTTVTTSSGAPPPKTIWFGRSTRRGASSHGKDALHLGNGTGHDLHFFDDGSDPGGCQQRLARAAPGPGWQAGGPS